MVIKESLGQRMRQTIKSADLENDRALIQQMAAELDIDFLDCAAALIHIYQADINKNIGQYEQGKKREKLSEGLLPTGPKLVRYRLEVGRKHSVSKEEIKDAFVQEAGVERKMIGWIEMHHQYTLIDLPEGMPNDIFYHLKTVEIRQHKLHIKLAGNTQGKKRNSSVKRGRHRTSQAGKRTTVTDAPSK